MTPPTIGAALMIDNVVERHELRPNRRAAARLLELAECAADGADPIKTGDVHRALAKLDSYSGHVCELDRWQTDPDDRDYLEPAARWCRVCLRHPDHPVHDVTPAAPLT